LPARAPRELEDADDDDEDDDDDDPSTPGMDFLNSLVAQIVPLVVTSMAGKRMPKLGAIPDGAKAVPQAPQTHGDATPATDATSASATEPNALPPLDPKMMAH